MPDEPATWDLSGFLERLDIWVAEQSGGDEVLHRAVVRWLPTRREDPYQGVRRAPGIDNLWYASIPSTRRGDSVVVCCYWIFEREHRVVCDSFATLGEPVG